MTEEELVEEIAEQVWLAHEKIVIDSKVMRRNYISWNEQKKHGVMYDTEICYKTARHILSLTRVK